MKTSVKQHETLHLWLNEALQWSSIFSSEIDFTFQGHPKLQVSQRSRQVLVCPSPTWSSVAAPAWGPGGSDMGRGSCGTCSVSQWSPKSSEDTTAALHPTHTAGRRQDHAQAGFCKKLQGLGRAVAGRVHSELGQHLLCNKTSSRKKYCPPNRLSLISVSTSLFKVHTGL